MSQWDCRECGVRFSAPVEDGVRWLCDACRSNWPPEDSADADEAATDLEERLELAIAESERLESYREARAFFREEHRK